MTDKLSRRSLLKMAAALATSGALAWKSNKLPALKVKAYYTLSDGTELAATEFEPVAITEIEQPFVPYLVRDRPATLITWGVDGEEIITKYD